MNMKKHFFLSFFVCLLYFQVNANNINITNVTATSTTIKFDISWENSWFISALNRDAAWVFIKVQDCQSADRAWKHAKLSTVGSDHSVVGPILKVDSVADGMGVFIRRRSDGFGTIAPTSITLKFQSSYTLANVNFEVMGIEMVYVPQGSFRIGDGASSSTYRFASDGATAATPYTIVSEAAIGAGALASASGGTQPSYNPTIPAGFPKGYNAFYCMKYEITQDQYTAFLNLLNFTQQNARTARDVSLAQKTNALSSAATGIINRNGIQIKTPGSITQPAVFGCNLNNNSVFDELADGGNIACNFLSWEDVKAYMDWSGLRPMTELEFEKSARGFDTPLANERAWGNTLITYAGSGGLTNAGEATELSTAITPTGSGLCAYGAATSLGPLRAGFAATQTTARAGAGASYWGIMELSGNVWEPCFNVGYANANASGFTGVLGDGELDSYGAANQANWGAGLTSTIIRGGGFASTAAQVQISARDFVASSSTYLSGRDFAVGGRGVRQF